MTFPIPTFTIVPMPTNPVRSDFWDSYIDSICQRLGVTDPETREQIDFHELMHLAILRDNIDAAVRLYTNHGVDLSAHFGL